MRRIIVASLLLIASCTNGPTAPADIAGTYTLVSENGNPLPSDNGSCCLTLSGTMTLTAGGYELRTGHRNKVNGQTFENSESGTYTRSGNTLTFTATGFGGSGFPYLLAPGELSADGRSLVLRYGDEGPGSNQVVAVFRR